MGVKLFKLLQLFTKEELTQIRLFLQSPFFVKGYKNSRLLVLFEVLVQSLNNKEEKFDLEEIYQTVFPNESIISGKLEKEISKLFKLIEQFIEFKFSDEHYDEKTRLLAQASFFRQRNATNFFQSKIKRAQKKIEKSSSKDASYFYSQYLLEKEVELYNSQFNTRLDDLNLPSTLVKLDVFFFYNRLKSTVSLLAQNIHTKVEYTSAIQLIELSESLLREAEYLQIPIIQVYFKAYQLLKSYGEEDQQIFKEFKQLLTEHSKTISENELKSLQTLLRIYSVSQYNSGKNEYLKESFKLYQEHLEAGYLYYENKIIPPTLKSIVTLGLRLGEHEWVYEFLKGHRQKIAGTHQPKEVYNSNLAYYYFQTGVYEKALDLLSDEYEDYYYKIGGKRMEIMIFYEQQSSLLEHRIDAFKMFIFRISKKNLPPRSKQASNNFIDILKAIINPKTLKNETRIEKIRNSIFEKKVVADKEWLLQKLEEKR